TVGPASWAKRSWGHQQDLRLPHSRHRRPTSLGWRCRLQKLTNAGTFREPRSHCLRITTRRACAREVLHVQVFHAGKVSSAPEFIAQDTGDFSCATSILHGSVERG